MTFEFGYPSFETFVAGPNATFAWLVLFDGLFWFREIVIGATRFSRDIYTGHCGGYLVCMRSPARRAWTLSVAFEFSPSALMASHVSFENRRDTILTRRGFAHLGLAEIGRAHV